ncbi:hypothetical protein BaRGS_00008405 [Batillaria attramentaria]|uniref:Uncharacterized protein n=1 Tax=Batillaria attramentaria TaxID=370345 RepID=A0ABD0LM06_9CAEN
MWTKWHFLVHCSKCFELSLALCVELRVFVQKEQSSSDFRVLRGHHQKFQHSLPSLHSPLLFFEDHSPLEEEEAVDCLNCDRGADKTRASKRQPTNGPDRLWPDVLDTSPLRHCDQEASPMFHMDLLNTECSYNHCVPHEGFS